MRKRPFFAICGVDEAGRGPLAGPVTAGAVIFPPGYRNTRIADSKSLTEQVREELYDEIVESAIAYACVSVGPRTIESINIRAATQLAMRSAIAHLSLLILKRLSVPDCDFRLVALIDGNMCVGSKAIEEPIIKGDSKLQSIGAASILAKVSRDRMMKSLDTHYPGYGFSEHKGYATPRHLCRIASLGPCPAHRLTFAGVREHLASPDIEVSTDLAAKFAHSAAPGYEPPFSELFIIPKAIDHFEVAGLT